MGLLVEEERKKAPEANESIKILRFQYCRLTWLDPAWMGVALVQCAVCGVLTALTVNLTQPRVI